MIIREIKIGELPGFVKSEEYEKLRTKPITPLRAHSQYKNPHADAEETALVFAAENDTLYAFAGIFPHKTFLEQKSLYSNSGWWANPEFGRQWAIPVFLKALQLCEQRMILTDCTAHTKSVLEKTGLFRFVPEIRGNRYFLRFYFGDMFRRKGKIRWISSTFSHIDSMLNSLLPARMFGNSNKIFSENYSLKSIKHLDDEHAKFIGKFPGESFFRQEIAKLNWIVQNPWVTTKREASEIPYPFTYKVDSFKQEFLEIRKENKLIALLLFSIRDNHASVPFIYYSEDSLKIASQFLWSYLIKNKVDSLLVYNCQLNSALVKNSRKNYLFVKNSVRYSGYSNTLQSLFAENEFSFQDGEADVAFT